MSLYLIQTLNGLGIGMIYFLIAVGLSVVFGIMNFVNFAHGAFYMLGAYGCYTIVQFTGSFWPALLLVPVLISAAAWLVERFFLNRLYRVPHIYQVLFTLGLALVLQECVILIYGPFGNPVPVPDGLRGVLLFGGFAYPKYRLFVIAFAAVLALVLWLLFEATRFGAILRAGTESMEMVSLLGIDVFKLFSLTFAIGAFLAALGGVLAAPIRGVNPFAGLEALAIGFVVVVIGGMGSLTGALAGSLLIGVVQSVMSSLWSEGANIMIYVAMAAIILMRPRGLLGRT